MPIVVPADDFPVDFSAAGAAITEIATLVTGGPSGLLTGPQKINCTTPDSISCFDVAMSPPIVPIPVTADPNSGALFLTGGIHRVHNSFVVDMGTWFYNSSDAAFATPPPVVVEAEGFVFVNVVDEVEFFTATGGEEGHVMVSRPWDDSADFACNPNPNLPAQSMPILGNYNLTDGTNSSLTCGIRTVATGSLSQDPATHLLVSLWTDTHVMDAAQISQDDADMCSGLRCRFS